MILNKFVACCFYRGLMHIPTAFCELVFNYYVYMRIVQSQREVHRIPTGHVDNM